MTTVVQSAASDAQTLQSAPTQNYAGTTYMAVTSNAGGGGRFSYLYFNRPFPLGATITSAKLRVHQKGVAAGGSRTLQARRITTPWQESKITYADDPEAPSANAATRTLGNGGADGRLWEFDVSAMLQDVSDGDPWYGFRLESTNTTLMYLFSRESALYPPTLEVEWSEAPAAPQQLAPANGRAVSSARPTFTFDFTDVTPGDALAAFQLQMHTSDSFTAPTIDTGEVPATVPAWTPAADIATGSVRYWRVRVKDTAGNWSPWSDSTSFIRTAKPTVTITNPAAAPNNVVYEPLPTFSWTVAGEAQVARQMFVTDIDDPTEVLWDSGKVTTAVGSATIPKSAGFALSPGSWYSERLRVWGSTAREATPGDPAYVEVVRPFQFGLSGAVPAVSNLVLDDEGPAPHARLSWSMPSTVTSVTVLRDGVTIAAGLEPADLLVTGSTYAWADVAAAPRVEHTWTVLAITGTQASQARTVTGVLKPVGVWLSTLDGEHAVFLKNWANTDPVTFAASEASEIYRPPGAANPVLITQAVFGREGRGQGNVAPYDDVVLADALAEWDALTDTSIYPRGTTMVLTLVDTAMKVFIYEVYRESRHDQIDRIPVGFRYCELL